MTDAPFGGLLDSFQLALETERKSENTIYQYGLAVTKFAEWLRVNDHVDEVTSVTADQVRRWLLSLQGTCAPSTEYRNYSGVRQFFRWCVAEDELDVSPMANIRPPKQPEPETPILTGEQMKALLADCRGKDFTSRRDLAIIMLLADTGMRRSEAAGITVDRLDVRGRAVEIIGKGDRTHRQRRRIVPFGAKTAQALDRYIRLRRTSPFADRPELWLAEKGRGVLGHDGIRQMLERRGERVGVKIHPHMFRHGWADSMLESGVSEGDVMQLGGWKSSQMLRRYGAANRTKRAMDAYRAASPMDSL